MSLLPYRYNDDLWSPSKVFDRRWDWTDDLAMDTFRDTIFPRDIYRIRDYLQNLHDTDAKYSYDADRFQADIDIHNYKPEEVSVKVTPDKMVTVEGRHEENEGSQYGNKRVCRQFVRKYSLPTNCAVEKVESKLSPNGVLSVVAPREYQEYNRTVPILRSGSRPLRHWEKKSVGWRNDSF